MGLSTSECYAPVSYQQREYNIELISKRINLEIRNLATTDVADFPAYRASTPKTPNDYSLV